MANFPSVCEEEALECIATEIFSYLENHWPMHAFQWMGQFLEYDLRLVTASPEKPCLGESAFDRFHQQRSLFW